MVSRAGFSALLCSSLVLITWSLLSSALQLEGARTAPLLASLSSPTLGKRHLRHGDSSKPKFSL